MPQPVMRRHRWLAGLAVAAAAAAVVNVRSRKAERENPPIGRFVEVCGGRLHYIELGHGAPLVVLHGNSSLSIDFLLSGVVPIVASRYRVIVFDRPGYGYSDPLPGDCCRPEAQARLIHSALRRMGVQEAIVLGHSWGALVAIALALESPQAVRGLILESGFLYPQPRIGMAVLSQAARPVIGGLARQTFLPLTARAVWPLIMRLLFGPAPVPKHFRRFPPWMVLRPSQIRTSAIELGLAGSATRRLSRRYRELRLPVAILAGRGDRIVDPKKHSGRLHAELRRSTFRVLDGVGHMVHHSNPKAVADAVDEVNRLGRLPPQSADEPGAGAGPLTG